MKGQITSGAIVTLKLEIRLSDNWGADCKLDQVFKQAEDGAQGAVRKLCEESHGRIRVLSIDEVRAITWSKSE